MTPIHLNRLNYTPNQFLHLLKPSSNLTSIILKIRAVALLVIPLIAAFFLYLIFSDSDNKKLTPLNIPTFNQLRLDTNDKKSIRFIIENMAQQSKWWLLNNSSEMNIHGDRINDIHPLKFISFIRSERKLKNTYLPAILSDKFKKMSFMRGLSQSLDEKHKNNLLKPYLDDFMKSHKIPLSEKEKLAKFIDKKDWHGFFHYLIKK